MPDLLECAECRRETVPIRSAAHESWTSEFGQVDRDIDVCSECQHIVAEMLAGPGARAWAESRAIMVVSDVA